MNSNRFKINALFTWIGMIGAGFSAFAQNQADVEAIKKLCGCFSVTFNYAETFTNDTLHKRYAHPMDNRAVVEYAYPIEESANRIVIQHLLVIPDGKGTVIKHWREDWVYQQTERWEYTAPNEWTKLRVPPAEVEGEWTQSVWEVTDAPRYMGSSAWTRTNNQVFWLNSADAPLPRREFTKRQDYNIMNRTNRIVVSDEKYVHEQDNKKIIRTPGKADSLLAEEKGYNTYVRLPEADCAGAKSFWTAAQSDFWTEVREIWEEKLSSATNVKIVPAIAGKPLYQTLDELMHKELAAHERKEAIDSLISRHVLEIR